MKLLFIVFFLNSSSTFAEATEATSFDIFPVVQNTAKDLFEAMDKNSFAILGSGGSSTKVTHTGTVWCYVNGSVDSAADSLFNCKVDPIDSTNLPQMMAGEFKILDGQIFTTKSLLKEMANNSFDLGRLGTISAGYRAFVYCERDGAFDSKTFIYTCGFQNIKN